MGNRPPQRELVTMPIEEYAKRYEVIYPIFTPYSMRYRTVTGAEIKATVDTLNLTGTVSVVKDWSQIQYNTGLFVLLAPLEQHSSGYMNAASLPLYVSTEWTHLGLSSQLNKLYTNPRDHALTYAARQIARDKDLRFCTLCHIHLQSDVSEKYEIVAKELRGAFLVACGMFEHLRGGGYSVAEILMYWRQTVTNAYPDRITGELPDLSEW